MPPSATSKAAASDDALQAALAIGLDTPASTEAIGLSRFLADAFGPTTVAVIHYGSRAQNRQPRADSAFDFFVVVDRYRDAYESLAATVGTSYRPGTATILAKILPPNVIAITQPDGQSDGHAHGARHAKICVTSLRDLARACSSRPRDHFLQGRLLQHVLVTWSRDPAGADAVRHAIANARARTIVWARPSLLSQFTVDEYAYAVLRRSLSGEIRPESGDHALTLVAAQRDTLRGIYTPLLSHLATQGALTRLADGLTYQLTEPPGWFEALSVRMYFQRSKVRNTVRLAKHVVLYEGWLDYILRKIERSGGAPIAITARERRWPLIFLWPKVFRYLRTRPQRRQ